MIGSVSAIAFYTITSFGPMAARFAEGDVQNVGGGFAINVEGRSSLWGPDVALVSRVTDRRQGGGVGGAGDRRHRWARSTIRTTTTYVSCTTSDSLASPCSRRQWLELLSPFRAVATGCPRRSRRGTAPSRGDPRSPRPPGGHEHRQRDRLPVHGRARGRHRGTVDRSEDAPNSGDGRPSRRAGFADMTAFADTVCPRGAAHRARMGSAQRQGGCVADTCDRSSGEGASPPAWRHPRRRGFPVGRPPKPSRRVISPSPAEC